MDLDSDLEDLDLKDHWEIKCVLQHKERGKNRQYLVKWVRWTNKWNSWVFEN